MKKDESEKDAVRECHHDRSTISTLHCAFTAVFDGNQRFWYVYCDVCGSMTEMCMTPQEPMARAEAGFWYKEKVGDKMRRCDRCDEKMRKEDLDARYFEVSYKPLSSDAPEWRSLTLCEDCQKDLRKEFYSRGLYVKP